MKYIYKFFATIFCAALLVASCSEDSLEDTGLGTITGTVVEEGNNSPIQNAKISTNPPSSTVFADENGEFTLIEIPTGEYSVQAEIDEYITAFEPANLAEDGATVNVIFELQPETALNRPPAAPTLVTPEDGASNIDLETQLVWTTTDPDALDELTYSVELRNDMTSEIQSFSNLTDTTLTVSNLTFATKYFWQVTVNDGINEDVNSEVSSFTTVTSPNNRIFFARKIGDNNVIYSSSEAAGDILQVTSENVNSWRPRRNNATQKVAFMRSIGAETHLFTMDEDGSNERQVTTSVSIAAFNQDEVDFSWEPNGERLFFPNFDKLYAIDQDGSGLELIYQTPDGSLITEVNHAEFTDVLAIKTNDINGYNVSIYTIDLNGSLLTSVLNGVSGAAGGIDISANGDFILFSYDVSGFENPNYRQLDARLFVFSVSGNTTTDISGMKPSGTNDLDPRFAPNDASVLYVNTSNDGISQRNLETVAIGDENSRSDFLENAFMPDWE